MRRIAAWAVFVLGAAGVRAEGPTERSFEPVALEGGIEVFLKADFDDGACPFAPEGQGAVALEAKAPLAVAGRSMHVLRKAAGGYLGARTTGVGVRGSKDLKIAFCVRARGMRLVTLNFHDALRGDNTTPRCPARVQDQRWRTVVFAVEDFRYNSEPPQQKIAQETRFEALLLHGQEEPGASGEFWIDKLVVYRGQDTQAPEAPHGLRAAPRDGGRVELAWEEPRDNAFAAVYGVFRKRPGSPWTKVGESVQPRFVDVVPAAGAYVYRVAAADYENNVSKPSADAAVEVASGGIAPPAAPQDEDRRRYAATVRTIHAAGRGKVRRDVVLFAGDSITAADAYTHTLGGWLGRGIPVREGVGGVRTDYGKEQIGRYLAGHRPEVAVVMYGTNNAKGPEAVEQAMKDLAAVIDACAGAGTIPILATIPPRGYEKEKQEEQVRYNQAVVRLCREKKVPVSYCFEEMMGRDLRHVLGDGVHLTPEAGNDAAGEALWKTAEQVHFALRDPSGEWR